MEAYQESAPTVRGSFNVYMPTGKTWRFHHWIYRGNAYLDDYREFSTGGLVWTPDEREEFTYDALDRLVGGSPVSGAQGYTVTYGYDPTGNITYATGVGTYVYTVTVSGCATGTVSAKPHAVGRAGSNSYVYDCNGNVTRRVELSGTQMITYYQEYDAENRLVAVTNTVTSLVTRFAYDGDGQRVKVTAGTTTTVYVGTYYEQRGSTVTRYYYLGGQRVAMRVGLAGQAGTLSYLHVDHLGSTSLATTGSGQEMPGSRTWYYPYGGIRDGGEGLPTDYTFTGQWSGGDVRLIHMGARWYDPQVGRWMSADTIVPDPANPQSLNRYSYVLGNPLKFTDPSGHCIPGLNCRGDVGQEDTSPIIEGILFTTDEGQSWNVQDQDAIINAVQTASQSMVDSLHKRNREYAKTGDFDLIADSPVPSALLKQVYEGIAFHQSSLSCQQAQGANCWASTAYPQITIYTDVTDGQYTFHNAAHELGHAFGQRTGWDTDANNWTAYANLGAAQIRLDDGTIIAGGGWPNLGYQRTDRGYATARGPWQQNWWTATPNEDFADMFLGWSYNHFAPNAAGTERYQWMNTNMADLVAWIRH